MCGIATIGDINGIPSREVRNLAAALLSCFHLREGCGKDDVHDGAGILCTSPPDFKRKVATQAGVRLPANLRDLGIGTIFLPQDPSDRAIMKDLVNRSVRKLFGADVSFGWRNVPVLDGKRGKASPLSAKELEALPHIEHLVIVRPPEFYEPGYTFEDHLFFLSKRIMRRYRERRAQGESAFKRAKLFPTMISAAKINYKMMASGQYLFELYPDLQQDDFKPSVAVVHNRFATNTWPDPMRAQPGELIGHNGEFNTLKGNQAWIRAAEERLRLNRPDLWKRVHPLMNSDLTDSGQFDDLLRLLCRVAHIPVDQAILLLMQQFHDSMINLTAEQYAFLEYLAARTALWAGPALIAFYDVDSDGTEIFGARNDLNGKRPASWNLYKNGIFYVGSEIGALPYPDTELAEDGQLDSGEMIVCRAGSGTLETNRQVIGRLASEHNYVGFVSRLKTLSTPTFGSKEYLNDTPGESSLEFRLVAAGVGQEEVDQFLVPMARSGDQPSGSMGRDAANPGITAKPCQLHSRFRHGHAQVTNPAIDSHLEGAWFSTMASYLGERPPLLGAVDYLHEMVKLPHPVISLEELDALNSQFGHRIRVVDTTYPVKMGKSGWELTLARLCERVDAAVEDGKRIIIVTDLATTQPRLVSKQRGAVSILLAISTLNEHLVRAGRRDMVSLIAVTDECIDPHCAAVLFGYGAAAVCPRGALQFIARDCESNPSRYGGLTSEKAVTNYIKAMNKSVLKVMAKMGIPAFSSYMGAKVFYPVGLDKSFVTKYFGDHADCFGGDGLQEVVNSSLAFHSSAVRALDRSTTGERLLLPAQYGRLMYSPAGLPRRHGPKQVEQLQRAVRNGDIQAWREFVRSVEEYRGNPRDLLELRYSDNPVPIEEVESVWEILKRIRTSPISHGSISQPAHESLAAAMNLIGGISGSGEGGEDRRRYYTRPNGWNIRSGLKQVASALFGVIAHYLVNAEQLEVKVSQGAKPGEGGELPGAKVTRLIAALRGTKPGVKLPSPANIHCLYSIEDLFLLLRALAAINPTAERWVKLVAEPGVGTVALGVRKTEANVWIAGGDGGTGSAPQISINNAGDDWETGIVEAHKALVSGNLRSHTKLGVDGGIQIPRHAVIAFLLGADCIGMGTEPLIALGCIQMKRCQTGGCLPGIATQDPRLMDAFPGTPEHVIFQMFAFAQGVREYLAQLGVRSVAEIVGQWERYLCPKPVEDGAPGFNNHLERLLAPIETPQPELRGYQTPLVIRPVLHRPDDAVLTNDAVSALLSGNRSSVTVDAPPIAITDIALGAGIAGEIARNNPESGTLPQGSELNVNYTGNAGHFFGFANVNSLNLQLTGTANGMVAMAMSGGRVVVRKFPGSPRLYLAGEAVAYGMTGGELYIAGAVGKMGGIRLSGGTVVVEGTLDNPVNFMTGGCFVSLRDLSLTGRRREDKGNNVAAGMSGGVAYFYSDDPNFHRKVNTDWVIPVRIGSDEQQALHREVVAKVEKIGAADVERITNLDALKEIVERHASLAGSARAQELLSDWQYHRNNFWQIVPRYALDPVPMPSEEESRSIHPDYWYLLGKTPEQVLAELEWMTRAEGLPESSPHLATELTQIG